MIENILNIIFSSSNTANNLSDNSNASSDDIKDVSEPTIVSHYSRRTLCVACAYEKRKREHWEKQNPDWMTEPCHDDFVFQGYCGGFGSPFFDEEPLPTDHA